MKNINKNISNDIFFLDNIIQNYPWGCRSSISDIFEISNDSNQPMAEIWMGAHPKASSQVTIDGKKLPLNCYVKQNKGAAIGHKQYQSFGELPYLFKVLSAGKALSIQVHPSKPQAVAGFARENEQDIPLDADHRQYKDSNHKPEIIYALTAFTAMNGFRTNGEILKLLSDLNSQLLEEPLKQFKQTQTPKGLSLLFKTVLSFSGHEKQSLLDSLMAWSTSNVGSLADLVEMLSEQYPGDIGLLAPLILNVVELVPGEAMFLDAGTPHAYIQGTGLEVMANSDNVLRAGLTPKHIDIDELLTCCKFEALKSSNLLIKPEQIGQELSFPVPVDDFNFTIVDMPNHYNIELKSGEIWFSIDAKATFSNIKGEELVISKGQSVFIPAMARNIKVTSEGKLARVF
ncbi:mannose-6-phosphate isomerase, class I [Photobacterium sp. DNB23_23_1]